MRWPWQSKPEERSTAQGYTASLTAALEAGASAGVADTAPSRYGCPGDRGGALRALHGCRDGHGCSRCGARADAARAGADRPQSNSPW